MAFEFEKISVQQISVFSEVVNESSLLQKEFIEKTYLRNATYFGETVKFLQELGLIETKENQVVLKPRYEKFLIDLKEVRRPKEKVKKFIIDYFIGRKTPFSEYLNEFLSQFHLKNKQYEFTPSASERLKYSGLRNFLIDLELMYLDSTETKYIIAEAYSPTYAAFKQSNQVSPEEFLRAQQRKDEIGKAAEIQIIKYEKERLSQLPDLVKKIEHTALRDVSAGYDIKSFDGKLGEDGNPIQRYIEVKAVSLWDYGFNWTRNEIEKSKYYSKDYYLYLLPVVGMNKFDLESLKIIRDPYSNVYKNENEWIRMDELLAFSLSKDSNK
jgi:hypothetical protein